MDRTKNRLAAALIAAGMLSAVLAVYTASYLAFSVLTGPGRRRIFNSQWQASAFTPAAFIESKIVGEPVYCGWQSPLR